MLKYLGIISFLIPFALFGQTPHFTSTVNKNTVALGERFKFELSISNGKGTITPPPFNSFKIIAGPSHSQSVQIINGEMTSTQSYVYYLVGTKTGKFTIPAATAVINGKAYEASEIIMEVVNDGSGAASGNQQAQGGHQQGSNSAPSAGGDIIASVLLSKNSAFEGEQLIISYVLYSRHNNLQIEDIKFPPINGFWSKEIKRQNEGWENRYEVIGGQRYRIAILRQEVLFPLQAGTVKIDPYAATCVINRSFFNQGSRVTVKSEPVSLNIQALPANKPEGFTGQVGSLKQEVTIDNTTVKANEAITLKIKISGQGNLALIKEPQMAFPSDFEVYDAKIKDNITINASGASGSREFEYLIIPRHAGKYEIPRIPFSYFDPKNKAYVSNDAPAIPIIVERGTGEPQDNYTNYTKEDVKILDQDIRYIRTENFKLRPKGSGMFLTPIHFAGLSLPLALFLLFLVLRKRQRNLRGDVAGMKRRRANKMAKNRLKEAGNQLSAGDPGKFYESVFKALFGYFSDKLNIPVALLTQESIAKELSLRGAGDSSIAAAKEILERCEMARFAPVSDMSMQEAYDATVKIISTVEEELKG